MPENKLNWKKYSFEFLSIFIAVISAFALNNWQENRRDHRSEIKILAEIKNGLEKDILDMDDNMGGHEFGIKACDFFKDLVMGKPVHTDSSMYYYYILTRDFNSIQNSSGYESLKSKGLEIVRNDSLRRMIIEFYEYDMAILKNLEENIPDMQFHRNYFQKITDILLPFVVFDEKGLMNLNASSTFPESQQTEMRIYLWKIKGNRAFMLRYYNVAKEKINQIIEAINAELEKG